MPVDRVPDALLRIVSRYRDERRPGESFHVWSRRTSAHELRSTLVGAAEPVTS
jgi:sulfite reductase beta subunit-like hemoprotein